MAWRRRYFFAVALFACMAGCSVPDWNGGDRVLVAKDLYDTGLANPQRYDVVVFKYPLQPVERHQAKNYIKRLLGLPGEIIAIFFGRLFGANSTELPPVTDEELKRPENANKTVEDILFEKGLLTILRKPPEVMLALRRIVYDNDYQPKDVMEARWSPSPKSAWDHNRKEKSLNIAGEQAEVDWIRYRHFVRPAEGPVGATDLVPKLITDTMGYNGYQVQTRFDPLANRMEVNDRTPDPNWVGDLMLECDLTVQESKGEFWMELSKGIYRFQAGFDLSTGVCTLHRVDLKGKREELGKADTRVKATGKYMIRLANIDARLTLWVDRDLPFGQGVEYHPPEIPKKDEVVSAEEMHKRRGPTANDLQPASLGAKNAKVKAEHVRIWRDTYYTASADSPADYATRGANPRDIMPPEAWGNPEKFDPIRQQRHFVKKVEPGHFLCLGDNSPASSDGRAWGLVPERLMLGRALMVYFPLHRLGVIR